MIGFGDCEYDGFVGTARGGRRKPRTQSYRIPITLSTTPPKFYFLPAQFEWVFFVCRFIEKVTYLCYNIL